MERDRTGNPAEPGLVHQSDAGPKQYTSFAFTGHLLESGIDASIGTVGDALDNALMGSQKGRRTRLTGDEVFRSRCWHGLSGRPAARQPAGPSKA